MQIDLNCDLGESYGQYTIGNDDGILPFISSCNVACGFHAGDPLQIDLTIKKAAAHGVRVGAHPGYPDRQGFGRRKMHLGADELSAFVQYQVAALKGMTEANGLRMKYVKPHGALYNSAAYDDDEALAIIEAMQAIDNDLALMGFAGSPIQQLAAAKDLPFLAEAFADRRYTPEGKLMSRRLDGAVITDPFEAAAQVVSIVTKRQINSSSGSTLAIVADSICIHGDNPNAVDIVTEIRSQLDKHDIAVTAD